VRAARAGRLALANEAHVDSPATKSLCTTNILGLLLWEGTEAIAELDWSRLLFPVVGNGERCERLLAKRNFNHLFQIIV